MAKQYRFGFGRRMSNVVIGALLRLGVPAPGRTSYLLTTRGRRTGLARTVPVNLVIRDGSRFLVSPYGDVGWVHNLRADPSLVLRRGRRSESLLAREVGAEQAGSVLKRYAEMVRVTESYFDAKPSDPESAFVREAASHPVFALESPSAAAF